MSVEVDSYAGYRGEQEPRASRLGERRRLGARRVHARRVSLTAIKAIGFGACSIDRMTIRPSIDVAARVSAPLARLIEKLTERGEEPPQTLGEVRAALLAHKPASVIEAEFLHPQEQASRLVELDALIEEFGPEARALDFVPARASEGLSRVIEAALEDPTLPDAPTLAEVRAAMAAGLSARLVGEGALDEDEEVTLLAEIDELIQQYGAGTAAEPLIRLE